MKNKINIFLDTKIKLFLIDLFSDYELSFIDLNEIQKFYENTGTNIIFINDKESTKLIDFKILNDNFLILSNLNQLLMFQQISSFHPPIFFSLHT